MTLKEHVREMDKKLASSLLFLTVATLSYRDISRGVPTRKNRVLLTEAETLLNDWSNEIAANSGGDFTAELRLKLVRRHAEWTAKTLAPVTLETIKN